MVLKETHYISMYDLSVSIIKIPAMHFNMANCVSNHNQLKH